MCSSSATALVVFFARSSSAPAQPTQNRYSTSSGILAVVADDRHLEVELLDPVQPRLEAFMPHGLPLFSRFLNSPPSSVGNADSISTW